MVIEKLKKNYDYISLNDFYKKKKKMALKLGNSLFLFIISCLCI